MLKNAHLILVLFHRMWASLPFDIHSHWHWFSFIFHCKSNNFVLSISNGWFLCSEKYGNLFRQKKNATTHKMNVLKRRSRTESLHHLFSEWDWFLWIVFETAANRTEPTQLFGCAGRYLSIRFFGICFLWPFSRQITSLPSRFVTSMYSQMKIKYCKRTKCT